MTGTEWVTGSSDGALALWSQLKKKPVAVVRNAHDAGPAAGLETADTRRVSALSPVPFPQFAFDAADPQRGARAQHGDLKGLQRIISPNGIEVPMPRSTITLILTPWRIPCSDSAMSPLP